VGGFVVEWLVIAVVAGIGVVALLDPGSIEALFTAEAIEGAVARRRLLWLLPRFYIKRKSWLR
jgi:hypothetical protein